MFEDPMKPRKIQGFTWTEYKEGGRKLAEAYKRGDAVCCGIKREEVILVFDDFAVYAPYIPLQVTPIVPNTPP